MHNGISQCNCHRETIHNTNVYGQSEDSPYWPRLLCQLYFIVCGYVLGHYFEPESHAMR